MCKCRLHFSSALLLAAASDAKKDALAKKYALTREELDQLANLDPTPNGVYTEGLTKFYKELNGDLDKVVTDIVPHLALFHRLKNSNVWKQNNSADINSYTVSSFIETMERSSREDLSNKGKIKEMNENAKKYIQAGVKYLGELNDMLFYESVTAPAAAIMAQGARWCTGTESTAQSYLSNGRLYQITKPGYENARGSDKLAQIYVSPTRIEAENAEGVDWSSNNKRGLILNETCFECLEFLSQFDPLVKQGLEEGTIRMVDESETRCKGCDLPLDEDEALEANGELYCHDCFSDNYGHCADCGEVTSREDLFFDEEAGDNYCRECVPWCDYGNHIVSRSRRSTNQIYGDNPNGSGKICSECFYEDFFECEECGDGGPKDEAFDFGYDTMCKDCFKKHWLEDVKSQIEDHIGEDSANEKKIEEFAKAEQNRLFEELKQSNLFKDSFMALKREGFLYDWDDLTPQIVMDLVPKTGKLADILGTMELLENTPIETIASYLADYIDDEEDPTEEWDWDTTEDFLMNHDILDGDGLFHELPEMDFAQFK